MKKIFTLLGMCALVSVGAQQLLTNPGFEDGLSPWKKGPTTSYTDPAIETGAAHEGTKFASYSSPAATTGFYQAVPVTAGKTYVISFWYKSGGNKSDTRLWSVYKNAADDGVYTTGNASTDAFRTNNGYLPSVSEWTKHTAEMPAGDGAVSLEVAIRAYKSATLAQFDDFLAYEKGTLSAIDHSAFEKGVKMNTNVSNELRVFMAVRSTVNIYSTDGKLVKSVRLNNGETIDTSSFAKGMYIVTVDSGTAKTSRKIIKK